MPKPIVCMRGDGAEFFRRWAGRPLGGTLNRQRFALGIGEEGCRLTQAEGLGEHVGPGDAVNANVRGACLKRSQARTYHTGMLR